MKALFLKKKEINYEAQPLKAAKLSNEPLAKLYNGFAKVGFGNYTMPFFEASFGSLRSKKYQKYDFPFGTNSETPGGMAMGDSPPPLRLPLSLEFVPTTQHDFPI